MKKLGLIGYPLSHSFSKKYFSEKFSNENIEGYQYDLYPIKNIEELPKLLLQNPELLGLNVTIPHKVDVLPYLDKLDDAAKKIGAVNCIKIENEQLIGYNTDTIGFEQSLVKFMDGIAIENALILGTGGAAKAVAFVLDKLKISYQLVSRSKMNGDLSYEDLKPKIIESHKLIVNTTPLGMAPNVNTCPSIDYSLLDATHYLYDLVYNPEKTLFLKEGEKRKSKTCNGLQMLILQAEAGWKIWKN